MQLLLEKKSITYDLLWHLFPVGAEVTFNDDGSDLPCAGKVWLFQNSSMLTTDHRLFLHTRVPALGPF
jgi:hypothetical protein